MLSTLPGGLVLAVKQLHDSMRQQFSDELALAREVAESRVIELEALNTTQAQELAVLRDESTTFQKELKGCKDEIQKVTSQYDAEMTRTRELRIRYESLEQLAAAGSAENRNLLDLVEQSRRQFEHFQASAQQRWEAERASGEQKLKEARTEFKALQDTMQRERQQMMLTQARLEQIAHEHDRFIVDVEEKRREIAELHLEISQLTIKLAQCMDSRAQLEARDVSLSKLLTEAEMHLAASTARAELLAEQAATAETRLGEAYFELANVSSAQAKTQAELSHCREQLRARKPSA